VHIRISDQPKLKLGYKDWTCNWGGHIAALYETEDERDEIVRGFLLQGDLDGDLQLYSADANALDRFRTEVTAKYPRIADHLDDPDRWLFLSAQELYQPDGCFSPRDMDRKMVEFYEDLKQKGLKNVRAVGDMHWALGDAPGLEDLMAYESRLNAFITGKPWISICFYDVTRFSGGTIMDVLRTHPFTITGGTLMENPYYVDPDEWLAAHAPQYLSQ
jgi:hypothetical protein